MTYMNTEVKTLARYAIIKEEMISLIESLEDTPVVPFFSYDYEVESKKVKKLIKAAKRIHNRFSIKEDKI